jgi:hypothetical protein
MSSRGNIILVLLISLAIVFFYNFYTYKDIQESIVLSTLNFDQSLTQYTDSIRGEGLNGVGWALPAIIILAHVIIAISVLIIVYSFTKSIFLALLFGLLIILGMHLIAYAFFDNNTFSFAGLLTILPFSGLAHFISSLHEIQTKTYTYVADNVTLIINNTQNVTDNVSGMVFNMTR